MSNLNYDCIIFTKNKQAFQWILTTFLSNKCDSIHPIKPNPEKPRNWVNFKQNGGVNAFSDLHAVLHTPQVHSALKATNTIPIAVKLLRPFIAIDIDYPFDSNVVRDIISYLADDCLAYPSRHGNAHLICRMSNDSYAKLFNGRKVFNGQLRYSNGNKLVHPNNPNKKTEFSVKSEWINCNLGLDYVYDILCHNSDVEYCNDVTNLLNQRLSELRACDDKLRALLKCHYPNKPRAKKPSRLNYSRKRFSNRSLAKFSLNDNITYCEKAMRGKWALFDKSDSSKFIFNIALSAAQVLNNSGNLNTDSLESVLKTLIPDWLKGAYSISHQQYSKKWINNLTKKIVGIIGSAV